MCTVMYTRVLTSVESRKGHPGVTGSCKLPNVSTGSWSQVQGKIAGALNCLSISQVLR